MKNALALSAFASTIMLASVTPVTAASNPLEVRDVPELTVLAMKGDQQKTLAMLNRVPRFCGTMTFTSIAQTHRVGSSLVCLR